MDTEIDSKIEKLLLSFRTAKDLQACIKTLPAGPKWLCEQMRPEYHTKQPVHLFYHNLLECLQALLSHPLLGPYISFVPCKVWMSTVCGVCRLVHTISSCLISNC